MPISVPVYFSQIVACRALVMLHHSCPLPCLHHQQFLSITLSLPHSLTLCIYLWHYCSFQEPTVMWTLHSFLMFSKQVAKEHLFRRTVPFVHVKLYPNAPCEICSSWLISSWCWLPALLKKATIFNMILSQSSAPTVTACQLTVYVVHCDFVFLLIPCTIDKTYFVLQWEKWKILNIF
jgi:hypothetical protein